MEHKFGYIESPKDYRDYIPYSASNVELPEEFSIINPHIKNQGAVNSCVAHSLSSMLEEHYKSNFSTGWIYGYRPIGYYQGEGMYPREALKTILSMGAVLNDKFPVNVEMQEAKIKVDSQLDELTALADHTKITGYARLSSVKQIKQWLYDKQIAVPVCIKTDDIQLDENNIIQIPKQYPPCGHCMLIVGWNKLGFIVQNSWGESWGDNGKAILPYEYEIPEAWGVTMNPVPEAQVSKPKFYIFRALAQLIREILRAIANKKY